MKKRVLLLVFVMFLQVDAITTAEPLLKKNQERIESRFRKEFPSKVQEIEKLQKIVQEYDKEKQNESIIKKYPKTSVATAFGLGVVWTFAFFITIAEN